MDVAHVVGVVTHQTDRQPSAAPPGRRSPPPPPGPTRYERLLPLVRRAAIRLARRLPTSVSVSDLVGAGLVGLGEALASVDPDARANGEYLWYRVHLSMLAFVHARGDVLTMASLRLVQAIGRAACASGRAPDEAQIAAAMGLACREYRVLLGALARARMTQLDLTLSPRAAQGAEPGRAGLAAEELAAALAVAMEELPSQLQQILALRHQTECTADEIGAALDLSESRVLELEVEAIHRLRAGMSRI